MKPRSHTRQWTDYASEWLFTQIAKSCYHQIRNIGQIRSSVTNDAFEIMVYAIVTACLNLVSLNRLSVGGGTTPRRQSGHIYGFCFVYPRGLYNAATSRTLPLYIFFKQLQICISIYFVLLSV